MVWFEAFLVWHVQLQCCLFLISPLAIPRILAVFRTLNQTDFETSTLSTSSHFASDYIEHCTFVSTISTKFWTVYFPQSI